MPWTDLTSILSSDALLGYVFFFAIAIASLKLLPVRLISERISERNGLAPGVSTAVTAYKSYEKVSKSSARKMRTAFNSGLRTAGSTKQVANGIGYDEKLERLERAVEVNAVISSGIYRLATTMNGLAAANSEDATPRLVADDVYVGMEDHAKVREALKHFVRDWSDEGRKERCQTFGLVLDALKRLEREVSGRRRRVLVPGAGLGRLAWEISQLGSFTHRMSVLKYHY